jgi:23S rRNA (guanosine2251-2'-O)-methyltransferase
LSSQRTEVVYGLHAVRTLLARDPQRVARVYLQHGRHDARADEIERLAHAAGRALERVDAKQLQARLGEAAVHQGVVAEVAPLAPWSEDDLLEAVTRTPDALLLALDGVQDPHNLGACLRTADACGVLALIVPRDRAAPLNATARKVAAGAAESTPVVTVTNLARTLGLLKGAGLWIVGADAAGAQPAHEIDLTGGRVLVMGAEGAGLRQLTRRHCDWLARLPSLGTVESLNVSVATGMLLYEALRQRAARG